MQRRSPLRLGIFAAAVTIFASGCSAATAQRVEDNPERSVAGSVVEAQPLILSSSTAREPLWSLPVPATTLRDADLSFVSGEGTAFFGERYGSGEAFTAYDERTGKVLWTSTLDGSPLAFADGLMFGVTSYSQIEHSRIVAFEARTGRIRWTTAGSWLTFLRGAALIVNERRLEARDALTGTLRWSAIWGGAAPREARVVGTTLLLQTIESGATMVGVLYAYDVRNGRPLWTGTANTIFDVLPEAQIAVDSTWGPGAYRDYGGWAQAYRVACPRPQL